MFANMKLATGKKMRVPAGPATVRLGGGEYVILLKAEFGQMAERLRLAEQLEAGEQAEIQRRRKEPARSLAEVKRKLGL